jgi:hypothetical protein
MLRARQARSVGVLVLALAKKGSVIVIVFRGLLARMMMIVVLVNV